MRAFLATLSCLGCLVLSLATLHAATPVLRVVKGAQAGVPLLLNGGFEAVRDGSPTAWQQFQKGFQAVAGAGRNGSQAIVCENTASEGEYGANQVLTLNRNTIAPLVVRGWSKAENVNGSADTGYSLYVDITYTDGTPLWGETANFHTGTHDWQQREFVILPTKPVKSLNVYCLFRGHTGKVWFDDVSVEEVKASTGTTLFQGVPVNVASSPPTPLTHSLINATTQDGLKLSLRNGTVTSLQVNKHELATKAPGGFLVRDVAANSDFYNVPDGTCPDLHLKVQSHITAAADHIAIEGRLSDTTARDRATTLVFALPLDATGWHWGTDMRRSQIIGGNGEYSHTVGIQCGSTGTLSLYPLAAIWNDQVGLGLALDMAHTAQYRLAYNAGTKQLLIAYDFGLVKETTRFPSSADFRFVLYRFDPHWGFRAALQKMHDIFPDYYKVRSTDQGIWMPFTDVSKVQGWQDFGFKYHEGDNNVPFDDAHNILSFRYTEPMTWWMPLQKGVPRTVDAALKVRDELAQGQNETSRRMAQVTGPAHMEDETGQPAMRFINAPWADGAVWSLNPNPYLPVGPGGYNAATVYWNDASMQRLYGPEAKSHLDGEYLDSIEGYVTADLNFRREHFGPSTVPLTFDTESKRPALYKGLAVYELTKWLANDIHGKGKLMFANGLPYRYTFLGPWLDVMGTETDWLSGSKYQPASDEQMCLWRTTAYDKPYLLLMNTNFDAFTAEMVERYFQRSLCYGIFPSMFSHNAADSPYWENPKWYNRDRPLFQKYIPLIKHIAEAGWQPVTRATCDNPHIYLERFGPDANGKVFVTLLNDTAQPQSGNITLDATFLKSAQPRQGQELISDQEVMLKANRFHATVQPQEAWLVQVSK